MDVSHVLEINVHFAVVDAVMLRSIVFVNHAGPSLPLGNGSFHAFGILPRVKFLHAQLRSNSGVPTTCWNPLLIFALLHSLPSLFGYQEALLLVPTEWGVCFPPLSCVLPLNGFT